MSIGSVERIGKLDVATLTHWCAFEKDLLDGLARVRYAREMADGHAGGQFRCQTEGRCARERERRERVSFVEQMHPSWSGTGRLTFSDDTQRAFRTNKDLGKIEPSRALSRSLASLDDFSVRQHNRNIEEPFRTCRSVPNRISSRAARRDHPPDRGARTWVEWEKELVALLGKVGVDVFPARAGLDDDVPVVGVHG